MINLALILLAAAGGVFSMQKLFYYNKENQVRRVVGVEGRELFKKTQKISKEEIIKELKLSNKNEFVMPDIDVSGWKTYRSNWYGFKVKYPAGWNGPILKGAESGSDWEYSYSFRKTGNGGVVEEEGFDITVYNIESVGEISGANELLSKEGDFMARQVYVSSENEHVQRSLLFLLSRKDEIGQYVYRLEPLKRVDYKVGDTRELVGEYLPEFFGVASSFSLADVDRPTPEEIARARAPLPVSFKWENGRRVCAKKNDKPGKSKKDKGHHLDMECCLDPDEDPNPHCYYSPKKYSKLLK